jgi:hypothetical protein
MCNCINEVNEQLTPQGLKIHMSISFTPNRQLLVAGPFVVVEKIDPEDRKVKLSALRGNFRPFCGEEQHPE